jgi:hypothetical protein
MIHGKSQANLSNHQSVCQMMLLEKLHIKGENQVISHSNWVVIQIE